MNPNFSFFLNLFKATFRYQPRKMGKTSYELILMGSADFITPIWNASLAFLGLSALVLLYDLYSVRSKRKKEGGTTVDFSSFEDLQKRFGEFELKGIFLATIALALSIVIVGLHQKDAFKEKGIIASVVPGLEQIQKTLLHIDATVSDIDTQMKGLKKETSENPRKELQNLGVAWSEENFLDAIKSGDSSIVRLFLVGGIHPETANDKGRPLPIMLALNKFNPNVIVNLLVANGLNVNRAFEYSGPMSKMQGTLLGSAIERGNTDLVRALLENKADVNGSFKTFGAMGTSFATDPLSASIYWRHFDILELLLDAGAKPEINDYAPYKEAERDLANAGWRAGTDITPLTSLLPKLRPQGSAGEKADAAVQLENVKRQLNEVAMKSLQSMGIPSAKARYDRQYDSLQTEKKRLETLAGNP